MLYRTWEAAYALRLFLTPSSPPPAPPSLRFSPPCPLFDTSTLPPRTIVEVGSGTGFVSLCLAPHLASGDTLVLTDLGEVCPLLEKNLGEAEARWKRKGVKSEAKVLVRPLPWGDMGALEKLRSEDLRPDVVLASDLVYFPELYGMLLRTLIGLCDEEKKPTLLFSYKTRSLVRETPFWSTFGAYSRGTTCHTSLYSTYLYFMALLQVDGLSLKPCSSLLRLHLRLRKQI